MKHRNSERGMAAFWFIFVMGIAVPAMVVFTMNYTSIVTKVKRITQTVTSKQSIYVVKNMILKDAADVDSDSRFELLKEEAGNTIPTAVVGKSTDEWGTEFFYCTWDLGALNGSDASYADNNVAPPVAGLAGRIISAGKDKNVETNCTSHTVAQGDDMMVEIYESDALVSTAGISGWTDSGSTVQLVNGDDIVAIGDDTASSGNVKLTVSGGHQAYQQDGDSMRHTLRVYSDTANHMATIRFDRAGGTSAAQTAVQSGMNLGSIYAYGRGDSIYESNAAGISFFAAENFTDSSRPAEIRFYTTPSGTEVPINVATMTKGGDLILNSGGIQVGAFSGTPSAGAIRWNGTNFQGYNGATWVNLDNP